MSKTPTSTPAPTPPEPPYCAAPAIAKVSVESVARSSTSCAALAPVSDSFTLAPLPMRAFVSSSSTLTTTEPPMPALEPPLKPAAMVISFSEEVAVSATPRRASVVRLPSPSRSPVCTCEAAHLPRAVTCALSPIVAATSSTWITAVTDRPKAVELVETLTPPAMARMFESCSACTMTLPSASTVAPLPIEACVWLSLTRTTIAPPTALLLAPTILAPTASWSCDAAASTTTLPPALTSASLPIAASVSCTSTCTLTAAPKPEEFRLPASAPATSTVCILSSACTVTLCAELPMPRRWLICASWSIVASVWSMNTSTAKEPAMPWPCCETPPPTETAETLRSKPVGVRRWPSPLPAELRSTRPSACSRLWALPVPPGVRSTLPSVPPAWACAFVSYRVSLLSSTRTK